jgi:hypothetical protein
VCDGEIDIGELIIGEEEGPATGGSFVGEVEVEGMRGRGRMPEDDIDLPLPLPSGLLPSFREIGLGSSGTGGLEVVIARGDFAT